MNKLIFLSFSLIFVLLFFSQQYEASNFKLAYYYMELSGKQALSPAGLLSDEEGNVLIIYNTEDKIGLSKIDKFGQISDTYSLVSDASIKAVSIAKDGDNALILASKATPCGCSDFGMLIKIKDRNVIWSKYFFLGIDTKVSKIVVDYDGNYIILASVKLAGSGLDLLIIKLDPNGNLIWYKIYSAEGDEYAEDIVAVFGDEYLVLAKETGSMNGLLILSIDKNGNLKWSKLLNVDLEGNVSTSFTFDSKYLIFGNKAGSAFLLLLERNGTLSYLKSYDDNIGLKIFDIAKNSEGGFMVAGRTKILNSEKAIFIKFDEKANQIASFVLNDQNTRFKFLSQSVSSNIILGDKDDNKLILFKTSFDFNYPSSDMFSQIYYPLKDIAIISLDFRLNNIDQELYINDSGTNVQDYSIMQNDRIIVLVDPQVTTVTARVGTTITSYVTYNSTTITSTSTITKTNIYTALYNETITIYSIHTTPRTVTLINTKTTAMIDFTDPLVIALLVIAFIVGAAAVIIYRRL